MTTEPLFGDIGPGTGPAAAPARDPDVLAVGDHVTVLAGRCARATAEVLELATVPTPTGGSAHVARIRRPRAGESWELSTNLRRID